MTATVGDLVMVGRAIPRAVPALVSHRLARVKEGPVAYPYVMACGRTAGAVVAAGADAGRCGGCWGSNVRAVASGRIGATTKSGAPATAQTAPGRVSDPMEAEPMPDLTPSPHACEVARP